MSDVRILSMEVIGFPGSGKTTYVNQSMGHIIDRYRLVQSRRRTIWTRLKTRFWEHVLTKQYDLPAVFLNKIAYRLSFRSLCPFRKKPVFYFDSGLWQVFLEYYIEHQPSDIDAYIRCISKFQKDDLAILYIQDKAKLSIEREMTRAMRRFPELDQKMLGERYEKAGHLIEKEILPLVKEVYAVDTSSLRDFFEVLKNEATF